MIFLAKYTFIFSLYVVFSKESAQQKGRLCEDLWEAFSLVLHCGVFEASSALGRVYFKWSPLLWYVRTCLPSYNILLFLEPEKYLPFLHLPGGYHRQNISCMFSRQSGTSATNTTALAVHETCIVFPSDLVTVDAAQPSMVFLGCSAVLSMNCL